VEASHEIHPDLEVSELKNGDKLIRYSELQSTHEDKLRTVVIKERTIAVYNLDVDGDDTFVVNNYVVHNK
jgi:intein/homing endonuclease